MNSIFNKLGLLTGLSRHRHRRRVASFLKEVAFGLDWSPLVTESGSSIRGPLAGSDVEIICGTGFRFDTIINWPAFPVNTSLAYAPTGGYLRVKSLEDHSEQFPHFKIGHPSFDEEYLLIGDCDTVPAFVSSLPKSQRELLLTFAGLWPSLYSGPKITRGDDGALAVEQLPAATVRLQCQPDYGHHDHVGSVEIGTRKFTPYHCISAAKNLESFLLGLNEALTNP